MTKKQKKEYRRALLRGTPFQRATQIRDISKELVMALSESRDDVDFAPFGDGCSPEAIAKAEGRLGVTFPPSYVWWLKHYGGGSVGGREIYSVYEDFYEPGMGDAVSFPGDITFVAERNRRRGASRSKLEIMSVDGDEIFYFDTSQRSEDGEWPIYLIESGSDEAVVYAKDFLEFLHKVIA